MTNMFIRHEVADFAQWRRVYDDFDATRTGLGVTGQAVYQSVNDPNDVTVSHEFANVGSAQKFAASAELHEAMSDAGIAGEPTIWFVEPA